MRKKIIYIYNIKLRAHRNKLIVICHNCHATLHVRLEEGEADGVLDGEEPPFPYVEKSVFAPRKGSFEKSLRC